LNECVAYVRLHELMCILQLLPNKSHGILNSRHLSTLSLYVLLS